MFSGSQSRQAISVLGAEQPLVQTGYESIFTSMLSDSYVKKANLDGQVLKVDNDIITLKLKDGSRQVISLEPKKLKSGQGQSSISRFKTVVKVGDRVRKNQILAEGNHIQNGVISVGCNLLCAVMMWKGYSFEDGYIISESVANQKFASESFHEIEILLTKDDKVSFLVDEGTETRTGEPLIIRSSKSIEALINENLDDVEEGKIITKSPGGRILSVEIYPNTNIRNFPVLRPQYERFKERYTKQYGSFPDKFKSSIKSGSKEVFSGILIKIKLAQTEKCMLGDKITNSFGGKGVLSLIEKEENMPVTPWGDKVEVILNPIAIINRMNPATIKELQVGLIAKFLAKNIVNFGEKKNMKSFTMIKNTLMLLDGTSKKSYSTQYMQSLAKLSDSQYGLFVRQIKEKNYFFPIIIPPFQEPSIQNIETAVKYVGAQTSYFLKLPEWNIKTQNPIDVGYIYYKKLEQQSGIKMSARSSGGLVNMVTGQPLAGRKVGGGQRIGEMDSWAILNHGAVNVLKEMFGPLSDDLVTKNQIINEIVQNGSSSYKEPKITPTKDLLKAYLQGLMLEAEIS
jgi:DNA-directed RNA polymerase subunit beta